MNDTAGATGATSRPCRLVVLGVTGSGKTTAAARAARALHARHVELDALYWGANWTPAEIPDFRQRILSSIDAVNRWVTDGGYASHVWDVTWVRADTVLWLDYPLPLILARLFRRSARRVVTRERLWNGNQESFRSQFLSRDSLFSWAVQTHGKYRRTYPEHFAREELRHLRVVRMRSPGGVESWLRALEVA